MDIQLEDFLEFYPSVDSDNFQTLITAKKEFSELSSDPKEILSPGKGFRPFKHQKFTQRYLRVYNDLLILSETGTGKTCEVLGFIEYVLKERKKLNGDEMVSNFKEIIVLVKSKTQKLELKHQLVCNCSDGQYITKDVKNANTEASQKSIITSEIRNAGYKIFTYIKFSHEINKKYPNKEDDDRIRRDFSNSIFWIDEAHNLIIDPYSYYQEKENVYDTILRVLTLAPNSKRIISTATPMLNGESDLISLINLILPEEKRIPKNFNFKEATLKDIEPYFRGRVSFIRAADIGVIPQEQGDLTQFNYVSEGNTYIFQSVIYRCIMSEFQSKVYNLAKKIQDDRLHNNIRQISNFVFPDETWGISESKFELKGFRKYISVNGINYERKKEFNSKIKSLEDIRKYSCKYYEIIKNVINNPGSAFVYGEFVEGSGVITLAMCFEVAGFKRYRESKSIFLGDESSGIKPICSEKKASERQIKPQFKKMLRYAILTGETPESEISSIMETMNSYENRYGEYIKVLISSRAGRDAINVNNVLQIHLIGPEWNQSSMHQAISRGIRATSHLDLLKEEQDKLMSQNKDPSEAKVYIKVYKYAAIPINESNEEDYECIDIKMYCTSEFKDRNIKRIMRMLKQCAIGCQIHYQRNVRSDDIDGSPNCDYDICKYPCVDPSPTLEDYSTYDILYSSQVIEEIINEILNIYHTINILSLYDIIKLFPGYRERNIIMALERIINDKIPIIDRFGFTKYLYEDGLFFYLDDFNVESSYPMAYYSQGLIGLKQEKLSDIVLKFKYNNQEIIDNFKKLNPKSKEFIQTLDNFDVEIKVKIFEEAFIDQKIRNKFSEYNQAVIDRFSKMFLFELNEPVTQINQILELKSQTKPRKGRKANPELKRKIKKINFEEVSKMKLDEDTEKVYIHIIYLLKTERTGYSFMTRLSKSEGHLRLLKPSEGYWRDLNDIELIVYNNILQFKISNIIKPFEESKIYGFYYRYPDKSVLIIRDKTNESKLANLDARRIKRGKECKNFQWRELINIMYNLGIPAPKINEESIKKKTKKEMINEIAEIQKINTIKEEMEQWPDEQIIYYYKWNYKNPKREEICKSIYKKLKELGRIIEY